MQDGTACPAYSEKHRNTSCAGPSCAYNHMGYTQNSKPNIQNIQNSKPNPNLILIP